MGKESDLQTKCLKWLGEHHRKDVLPANIHGGGWSAKGFPDVICCINGRYVAFELKVGTNGMQADQRVWRERILRCGGLHYTPRTLDEFQKIVEDIINDSEEQ